jgi:hypothetical protein
MDGMYLVPLSHDDVQRIFQIASSVAGISTLEGAIKWALENVPLPTAGEQGRPVGEFVWAPMELIDRGQAKHHKPKSPKPNPSGPKIVPLPPEIVVMEVFKIQPHKLAGVMETLVVPGSCLDRLSLDETTRANLFNDAYIGILK